MAGPVRDRRLFAALLPESTPLELRIVGRTLLHAALVGAAAGVVGALFFAGLELVQRFLLEDLAGYEQLRAHGETFLASHKGHPFRPWLLALLPAVGALLSGLITILAPETRGGGGDAMIHAYHREGGHIRRRVTWVKAIASILTLGTGGAGGREGPTMQIGGALGALVARYLKLGERERRILLVAGVAAGMAAVFRTPLGAALLAVEVLYRDDFESDALIPAVLASVVAYSVVIAAFGETTLFAHREHYAFVPAHLPLYGLLALLVSLLAATFVGTLRAVQGLSARLKVPAWAKPGLGGLALGVLVTPIIWGVGNHLGSPGQGLGIFGGGYGTAQIAITGASWLPEGWGGVEILLLLCVAKLVASSLTIGSGGSAGDFAPSLVLGGVFGGAFGRALQLLLHDPRIDPGAFALVGMGTFYGGIAHAPLSSLIMVCELAGSYDLLVPLMLAEGIAFVALRKWSLYHEQVPLKRDSPAHRDTLLLDVLRDAVVKDVMTHGRPFVHFERRTPVADVLAHMADNTWQDAFPVLDEQGVIVGTITADELRVLHAERELDAVVIAADVMQPPVTARADEDLRSAMQKMVARGLREIPVVDEADKVIGFLDEADIARRYVESTRRADSLRPQPPPSA